MGLEPMTSPLPRECSTTELHQRSCSLRSSIRARMFAITTRNAKSPKNKIGSHRISTSRSAIPTYLDEYPCMWMTAAGSIVNHDSNPKTTKTPSARNIRPRSAAGLSDRSIPHSLQLKNGAQGRIRTFVAHNAADLQSAAINHSATCALCYYYPLILQPLLCQPLPATQPRFLQIARAFQYRTKSLARNPLPELSMANAARGNNWQVQPTSFSSTAPQISGAGEGI